MRCPNCSKFVPFDEPEVEVQSAEVQDTNLDLSVRVVLKCADCGEELKDAELSDTIDLHDHHDCKASPTTEVACTECDGSGEVDSDDGTSDEKVECKECSGAGTVEEDVEVDDEFTMDNEPDASGFDRYEDKDRNGKPIKSARYMKHFYGANLSATCKCGRCGEEFSFETTLEEQASGFNELV